MRWRCAAHWARTGTQWSLRWKVASRQFEAGIAAVYQSGGAGGTRSHHREGDGEGPQPAVPERGGNEGRPGAAAERNGTDAAERASTGDWAARGDAQVPEVEFEAKLDQRWTGGGAAHGTGGGGGVVAQP